MFIQRRLIESTMANLYMGDYAELKRNEDLYELIRSDFQDVVLNEKTNAQENMWYAILMKEIGRNKKINMYLLICTKRNTTGIT